MSQVYSPILFLVKDCYDLIKKQRKVTELAPKPTPVELAPAPVEPTPVAPPQEKAYVKGGQVDKRMREETMRRAKVMWSDLSEFGKRDAIRRYGKAQHGRMPNKWAEHVALPAIMSELRADGEDAKGISGRKKDDERIRGRKDRPRSPFGTSKGRVK